MQQESTRHTHATHKNTHKHILSVCVCVRVRVCERVCCNEGRGGDEVDGRGEGVVSLDEPGEEAEEGEMAEKVELPEDLL